MKKVFKVLLKLSLLAFVIGFSMIAYVVYQLETSIDDVLSQEQKEWLFTSVENAEELPEIFYITIEKYYPDFFRINFWGAAISSLNQENRVFCQCHSIYYPVIPGKPLEKIEKAPLNMKISFQKPVVSLELEEKFSQKQCFNFSMSITSFGMNTIGIKEAADKFYNKNLEELTEIEILELVIIQEAPAIFNPFRHREKLDKAVERVLNSKIKN